MRTELMIDTVNVDVPTVNTGAFTFGIDAPSALNGLVDDWEMWFRVLSPDLHSFADFHRRTGDWLQSIQPGERPRPQIDAWFRGSGKSTFAEHGVAYLAERKKRSFAMYVCSTQDAAERHVQNIRSHLERIGGAVGTRLEDQYGSSRGWKKSMLRTASGFNIVALGLDVAMRGIKLEDFRPDVIILDDIDGRHDTPHITRKKQETITDDIIPAGSDDVAIWGVQNLIKPDGIFAKLVDGRADHLQRRIVNGPVPAVRDLQTEKRRAGDAQGLDVDDPDRHIHIITGGTPTWPEGKDLKDCQEEIIDQGFRSFDRENQHNVEEAEGALWSSEELNATRVEGAPALTRTVVGVDPASKSNDNSDETGIIAAGRDARPHGYVLEDWSAKLKPKDWGRRAVMLHDKVGAGAIVAETNQGGEMVEDVIQNAAERLCNDGVRDSEDITVVMVNAADGKRARAEPIEQRYDEHQIHHVGTHRELERQMRTWDARSGGESPDRVDALVWAMHELVLGEPQVESEVFFA
jgi:hypothetical protein